MATDTLGLSTSAENASLDGIVDLLEVGSGANAVIKIYDSADNLLVECNASSPAFANATSGSVLAEAISDGTAIATGQMDYFYACNKDGDMVFSGDISIAGGDGFLQISGNTLDITIGGTVAIESLRLEY